MPDDTLTALSQRPEAFWIGVVLLFGGAFVPANVEIGGLNVAGLLIAFGIVIITVRLLVGIFRILRNTALAGWIGYSEGKSGN